jgi:hypothetical protein
MSLNLIEKFKLALPGWKARMAQWGVDSAYAVIAASAVWPLVLAAQAGDPAALAVNFGGSVASNLFADKIMKWRTQADAAHDIAALPKSDPARQPLDALLQKVDAFAAAREALPAEDRRWFQEALREELGRLGNLQKFEVQIGGISAKNLQINHGPIETQNNQFS